MGYGGHHRGYSSRRGASEEVEDFIRSTGVDEKAGGILRNESEDIIRHVLDAGIRSECRNPSSMLMSLIKKARQDTGAEEWKGGSSWSSKRRSPLDEFIEENQLDERVQEELHKSSEDIVRRILENGTITAKNPSSCVMALLRKYRTERSAGGGDLDMLTFIRESQIDGHAEEVLRRQPDHVIFTILDEGVLSGWNASAQLLKRIRDLNDSGGDWGGGGAGRAPAPSSAPGLRERSPLATTRISSPRRPAMRLDLRSFIRDSGVDEEAASLLRGQSKDTINAILAEGPIDRARNPSSVLVARIKQLQAEGGADGDRWRQSGGDGGERRGKRRGQRSEVAHLRRIERGIDKRLAAFAQDDAEGTRSGGAGSSAPPAKAWAEAEAEAEDEEEDRPGDDFHGRGVWGQPAEEFGGEGEESTERFGSGGDGVSFADDVEDFIAANGFDAKAADVFRSQSEETVRAIMGEGSIEGSRNPSSLVMSRIRQLTEGKGGGAGGSSWHKAEDGSWGEVPWKQRTAGPISKLDKYVRVCHLDKSASAALYAGGEAAQAALLAEPWPKALRNPSAFVTKRIRALSREVEGGGRAARAAGRAEKNAEKRSSEKICHHYRKGKCLYGDKCIFRHEGPADLSADASFPDTPVGLCEREMSEALEDLNKAAWDHGLPADEFEALFRRVAEAREALVDALMVAELEENRENDDGERLDDDEDDGAAEAPIEDEPLADEDLPEDAGSEEPPLDQLPEDEDPEVGFEEPPAKRPRPSSATDL